MSHGGKEKSSESDRSVFSAGDPWGVAAGWVYIISRCPLASCCWLDVHGQLVSLGEFLLAGCTLSAGVPWGVAAGWVYIINQCPLGSCCWLGVHHQPVSLGELLLAGCTWSAGVPWGVAAGWVYMVRRCPLGVAANWVYMVRRCPLGSCCWLGVHGETVSLGVLLLAGCTW